MGLYRSYRHRAIKCLMLIGCSLCTPISYAEYFGSPTGRTAKFSGQPQLSVEATMSNGEFAASDYQQMGIRLNYQYSQKVMAFGDIGQSEIGSASETSFGFGAYYSLAQSVLGSADSAIKLSLHQVNFSKVAGSSSSGSSSSTTVCDPYIVQDYDINGVPTTSSTYLDCREETSSTPGSTGSSTGGDIRNIAIELLISGAMSESLFGDKANWYANGGIQMLDGFREDDTVLGFGAGVVIPFSQSEVYVGADYADNTSIGFGYRIFIQ